MFVFQKIAIIVFIVYFSQVRVFALQVQGVLVVDEQIAFQQKCMQAKCEIEATLHGRTSYAKGFVIFLTEKQQKIFGKKMLVIASGHQFLGWSKAVQEHGHGKIVLKFKDVVSQNKSKQEVFFTAQAQYLHHEVNRKHGDYSILVFEPSELLAKSIRPIALAPRDLTVTRDAGLYASSFPSRLSENEKINILSIFRYPYRYNQEHGFYQQDSLDQKVIITDMEAVPGCSGGALFLDYDGEPVVFGNCINRLGESHLKPADFLLGNGLIGPQAQAEVKDNKIMRGVLSMFNHVNVLHDALDRVCKEERNSQLALKALSSKEHRKFFKRIAKKLSKANKESASNDEELSDLNAASDSYLKALRIALNN